MPLAMAIGAWWAHAMILTNSKKQTRKRNLRLPDAYRAGRPIVLRAAFVGQLGPDKTCNARGNG